MTQTHNAMRAEDRFQEFFARFQDQHSSDPAWLRTRRDAAIARFAELGFPTSRHEAWKYTPVKPMVAEAWSLAGDGHVEAASAVLDKFTYWEDNAVRITFVDGVFCPALSLLEDLPDGLKVTSVAAMAAEQPEYLEEIEGRDVEHLDDGFRALNSAFSHDGAFVEIAQGKHIERPIHILYVSGSGDTPFMCHPRNIVSAGAGSQCTIVERYAGCSEDRRYLLNGVTEFWLSRDARIKHYKIQFESDTAFHIGSAEIHQDENSTFETVQVAIGAAIGRSEFHMAQGGPHTNCSINGVYIVDGERVSDQYVVARHTQDHSNSEQFFKGIIDDKGLGIFNGAIVAEEGVKGTDAHQTNKNLLLSDGATAETRPQLEIYCDDIACSHGATVGQLDMDSLFYLRSRGIDEDAARSILTRAFAGDVIEKICIDAIREKLDLFLADRVAWEHARAKGGQ